MDDFLSQTSHVDDQNRPTITPEKLKDFIVYVISNIVTVKEEVDVTIVEDMPSSYTVHVKVSAEDKGRVIGKKGNTINALRALVRVFGRIIIVIED